MGKRNGLRRRGWGAYPWWGPWGWGWSYGPPVYPVYAPWYGAAAGPGGAAAWGPGRAQRSPSQAQRDAARAQQDARMQSLERDYSARASGAQRYDAYRGSTARMNRSFGGGGMRRR